MPLLAVQVPYHKVMYVYYNFIETSGHKCSSLCKDNGLLRCWCMQVQWFHRTNEISELCILNWIHIIIFTYLHFYSSFLNDSSYREAIENSANYNTRLCIERRLRMPFLDSQTGNSMTKIFVLVSVIFPYIFVV